LPKFHKKILKVKSISLFPFGCWFHQLPWLFMVHRQDQCGHLAKTLQKPQCTLQYGFPIRGGKWFLPHPLNLIVLMSS
jgi:hypothetical protein